LSLRDDVVAKPPGYLGVMDRMKVEDPTLFAEVEELLREGVSSNAISLALRDRGWHASDQTLRRHKTRNRL
jgi:hypothetical protein